MFTSKICKLASFQEIFFIFHSFFLCRWSVAHCRLGQSEQLDVSLFCLAVENFCCQLEEKSQLESFLLTMNEAANRNSTSFYCRARDIITNYCNLPLKN